MWRHKSRRRWSCCRSSVRIVPLATLGRANRCREGYMVAHRNRVSGDGQGRQAGVLPRNSMISCALFVDLSPLKQHRPVSQGRRGLCRASTGRRRRSRTKAGSVDGAMPRRLLPAPANAVCPPGWAVRKPVCAAKVLPKFAVNISNRLSAAHGSAGVRMHAFDPPGDVVPTRAKRGGSSNPAGFSDNG